MTRRYVPTVGDRVRLRQMSDYSALNLPYWTTLHCYKNDGNGISLICVKSLTADQIHDGETVTVPIEYITPPIGWKERYTIHVAPDKVADVQAWMSRGVTVRQSQYIGDGTTFFQPNDNADVPHWRAPEVTDVIPPELTKDCIQIVKLEQVYDAFVPAPCGYCNGTGIHTTNPSLEEQTKETTTCRKCGYHVGFSFTEPWHMNGTWGISNRPGHVSGDPFCSELRKAGECWVCDGTGKGGRHLGGMEPKKERKAAIKQLEAEGWTISYRKQGKVWIMERETVVKDFGQEVAL